MTAMLGGLAPATFLREYWQKRPLLVRQAIPGFAGIVDRDAFLALATRDDATSRLVIQHPRRKKAQWERHDGPFGALDAAMLPASHWTLLVHGVESLLPGGWELLRRFSFIPTARVDDLMVSYAVDGGTVGPHDDLYDVFLLQGPGCRRWQVSRQKDRAVDADAAIRVLRSFEAEEEWLLEPGDMLYLPPGVAHWGVAEGPCFTYSIGFLAPTHVELVQQFLGYLGEAVTGGMDPGAMYADPGLKPQKEPLDVSDAMVAQVAAVLDGIKWDRRAVEDFVGRFLTRKKPREAFAPPARAIDEDGFARKLRGRGGRLTLALPTRGLVRGGTAFLNGEAHGLKGEAMRLFRQLVGERSVALPVVVDDGMVGVLHAWYLAGYLGFQ